MSFDTVQELLDWADSHCVDPIVPLSFSDLVFGDSDED